MSTHLQQFTAMIRKASSNRSQPVVPVDDTLMTWCEDCQQATTHERTPFGWRCVLWFCHRPKPLSEHGYIRSDMAEVLSWLSVVVIVALAVMHWWPW